MTVCKIDMANTTTDSMNGVPDSPKKKRTMTWLIYFFVLCFLFFSVTFQADFIARRLVFHPPNDFVTENEKMGGFEKAEFQNARNEKLVGHFFPFDGKANGTILYCHGNGVNISHLTNLAMWIRRDLQCNILVFDYAGYGLSEGTPTTSGILEDGRAARNWLAKRVGISPNEIIMYGQSLGGSVATDIAAFDGARALIIESSFTSLGDMGVKLFPIIPANWLLKQRLASVEKIGKFKNPVWISHGKKDTLIPFSQGERLFEAANEPKTFFIPSQGFDYHSAPHSPEFKAALKAFIDSLK
ncbi:MAG: alpha/beta hydrolase [Thermoguttaceae bacterium]